METINYINDYLTIKSDTITPNKDKIRRKNFYY